MQVPPWTTDLLGTINNVENTVAGPRSEWDILFLGGIAVLGVVKVRARIDTGTDVQKARGQKRASVVDNGSAPVAFTITIEIQSGEITAFARDIVPLIRPKTKTQGQPRLKIRHPEAAIWGVGIVKVTNVTSDHPASGGTKIVTLDVIEDVPPAPNKPNNKLSNKPAPTTPDAAIAANSGNDATVTKDLRASEDAAQQPTP